MRQEKNGNEGRQLSYIFLKKKFAKSQSSSPSKTTKFSWSETDQEQSLEYKRGFLSGEVSWRKNFFWGLGAGAKVFNAPTSVKNFSDAQPRAN